MKDNVKGNRRKAGLTGSRMQDTATRCKLNLNYTNISRGSQSSWCSLVRKRTEVRHNCCVIKARSSGGWRGRWVEGRKSWPPVSPALGIRLPENCPATIVALLPPMPAAPRLGRPLPVGESCAQKHVSCLAQAEFFLGLLVCVWSKMCVCVWQTQQQYWTAHLFYHQSPSKEHTGHMQVIQLE